MDAHAREYHSAHRELARTRDQMLDGCRRLKGELEEYKVKSDVWYDQAVARLLQIAKEAEPAVSDQMMAELNQILIEGGMMKSSRPNLTLVYSKEKDT